MLRTKVDAQDLKQQIDHFHQMQSTEFERVIGQIRSDLDKELLSKILDLKKDTIDLTNCKVQDIKNTHSE